MLLDELATLSATRVPSPGVFGYLKWSLLRPWRRIFSGNLAETAHALRRYITESEQDRLDKGESLERVQKFTADFLEPRTGILAAFQRVKDHLAGIQDDYDAFKRSMADTIAALEKDGSGVREHVASLQADSDLFKSQTGETLAAMQKDTDTLTTHLGEIQQDIDLNKNVLGEAIAGLQKDADTLRAHLAGLQDDIDAQKTTSNTSTTALQEDAEALRDHVAALQVDHDRVAGMAARHQAVTDKLHETTVKLGDFSSDLHHDLSMLAEVMSRYTGNHEDRT